MKYSKERAENIIQSIRDGNYNITAALSNGITEETFYTWMKEKSDFSESVKEAQAEAESKMVEKVVSAADDTWQAAAWYLERKNYRKWGKVDTHNVINKELSEFMENLNNYRELDDKTEESS